MKETKARLNKLKTWLDSVLKSYPIPSINILDTVSGMLNHAESKSRYGKIADLKAFANSFSFLQANHINTLEELQEKLSEIRGRYDDIHGKMKKAERRLKVLTEHISQSEIYLKHKGIYKEYQNLKPKYQQAFYDKHADKLIPFQAAERYLKNHMGNHKTLPLTAWKNEFAKLTEERKILYQDFCVVRDEVKEVETIKRSIEQALKNEQPTNTKKRDMEI